MMEQEAKVVIGTGNAGKAREIREALAGVGVGLVGLEEAFGAGGLPPAPEETGAGFLENAGIKARAYSRALRTWVLAEDSGLEADALSGGPGVLSARWLGRETPYSEKNRRLIEAARRAGAWEARYRCQAAIADPDGRIRFRAAGTVEGRIAQEPRGSGGFGYDPVFFVPELGRTMAELAPGEKRRISHRGRAMERVRRFLGAARTAGLI